MAHYIFIFDIIVLHKFANDFFRLRSIHCAMTILALFDRWIWRPVALCS